MKRWIAAVWLALQISGCSTVSRLPECRGPWVPIQQNEGGIGHG